MEESWLKVVINRLLDKPLIIQLPLLKTKDYFEIKIILLHISTLSITFNAFRADHPPMEA
jgi:hypothetical protein